MTVKQGECGTQPHKNQKTGTRHRAVKQPNRDAHERRTPKTTKRRRKRGREEETGRTATEKTEEKRTATRRQRPTTTAPIHQDRHGRPEPLIKLLRQAQYHLLPLRNAAQTISRKTARAGPTIESNPIHQKYLRFKFFARRSIWHK